METKIISAILISVILGSVIGFGLSYTVFNSQIQSLQNDLANTKTNLANNITNLQNSLTNTQTNLNNLNSTTNSIKNNVTNLQNDLSNTQTNLNALNATMSSTVNNLQNDLTNTNTDVSNLNSTVNGIGNNGTNLQSSLSNTQSNLNVAFDSGWIDITDKGGQSFNVTHNLNSTDIIVDITGKNTLDGGVHQRNPGGTGCSLGWSKTYGGTYYEYASSIIKTVDGGYAIAGYTTSFGAGMADVYLVKTDVNGNMQWNKT